MALGSIQRRCRRRSEVGDSVSAACRSARDWWQGVSTFEAGSAWGQRSASRCPCGPTTARRRPARAAIHANRPADRPDAIRVLVVDDHEVVRRGIHDMLDRSAGITVVGEAGDGESALAQIAELKPDVTLLDVAMPRMDGVRTLQELRRRGLTARVILLSVFAKEEQIFEGIRSGARGYLVKDTGRDDLIHAIRAVHGGGSLLPPVIAERLADRIDQGGRDDLTDREREILQHLASGATNKEIARAVSLSSGTVKWHIANVFQKLGASTRTEAVRVAQERGLTARS